MTLDYDPDGMVAGEGLGAVAGGDDEEHIGRFLEHVVRFATGASAGGAPYDVVRASGDRAAAFARSHFAEAEVLDALEDLLRAAVSGPFSDPGGRG